MKEVLQTKAFSGSNKYSNSIALSYDKKRGIEKELGLSTISIWADFEGKSENELSIIRISDLHKWSDFDELICDISILVKEFTHKYGAPDAIQDNYVLIGYGDVDKHKKNRYCSLAFRR